MSSNRITAKENGPVVIAYHTYLFGRIPWETFYLKRFTWSDPIPNGSKPENYTNNIKDAHHFDNLASACTFASRLKYLAPKPFENWSWMDWLPTTVVESPQRVYRY